MMNIIHLKDYPTVLYIPIIILPDTKQELAMIAKGHRWLKYDKLKYRPTIAPRRCRMIHYIPLSKAIQMIQHSLQDRSDRGLHYQLHQLVADSLIEQDVINRCLWVIHQIRYVCNIPDSVEVTLHRVVINGPLPKDMKRRNML